MSWFSPFFQKCTVILPIFYRDFLTALVVWCSHGTGSVGHRVNGFRFLKKCPKCKTHIWNAEMTKVIVRCLLLDWNHWMSVHAMNFCFYLWLLKILWPENTSSQISRHLEFIRTIEQGHRVNWVSGSLDSRVTGSLGHKMWPSSISDTPLSRRPFWTCRAK